MVCRFIASFKLEQRTDDFIIAIGRLCEKCDGKWYATLSYLTLMDETAYYFTLSSPVCDSYVRPETLVRICDECNFGTYGGRCIICGAPGVYLSFSFPSMSC